MHKRTASMCKRTVIPILLGLVLLVLGILICQISKMLGAVLILVGLALLLSFLLIAAISKNKSMLVCPNCGEKIFYKLPIIIAARHGHVCCPKCGTLLI